MEANSVMGKHEFVITVSNILPEFKSLPDWQKEAAYSQFSRDIEETTWDNDHLDPAELGQVMFSSGQLESRRDYGTAEDIRRSSGRLSESITVDTLGTSNVREN